MAFGNGKSSGLAARRTTGGPSRDFRIVRDKTPDTSSIPTVQREAFNEDFAENYTPAHVLFLGPTRRGKTTQCFQLLYLILARHEKKRWRAVILHGKIKKRDEAIPKWAKKSNYRIVKSWPPGPTLRPKHMKFRVRGYVLRPLKNDDISAKEEEKLLQTEFAKAIRANYHRTRGVTITVVDERAQADKDLRLTTDLDAPLQRGLPHNPEWNLVQRGAWVSYHCYDAPEHIFIYKSDDAGNRERYAELGCGDPGVIEECLKNLKTEKSDDGGTISQALYIRRSDRYMCIVDT